MYPIVRHQQFSSATFLWEVGAPDIAAAATPGQFVMLRLREGGERIPLTIADFDRERGTVTLVVQAVGRTTREMMRVYTTGDQFSDLAGPLGMASEIEAPGDGHIVVVGGGLGVAPVFPQLRAFAQAGFRTTAIIGFRSKDLVFWEDEFRTWADELIVCTDDGSYGMPGFVTGALQELLGRDDQTIDRVVAVGPLPMMQACAEVTRPHAVPTVVSLNAIMVDGTGMCGACRVTVDGKIRFACVDGPEFDAHLVDFPELTARQRRFKPEEKVATDDYAHVCNLEKTLVEDGKRNYKKIKLLAPVATPMPERPADERSRCFEEVNLGYSTTDALAEAERCIQCSKPTCIAGCPVSIDIPRFIRRLLVRDMTGALDVINETNLFPSICGRVCPQESQCEAQCIIGRKVQPVAIGRLERFVGDNAKPASNSNAGTPNETESIGGKVAIVGSGPGGLACAADLAKRGVQVTIYEALHVVGGVLSYGIPAFRLPRPILAREVDRLKEMGVRIETNKIVGRTFGVAELMGPEKGFDAVFIATGAGYPSFLGIEGENAGRVYSANEFLTRVNLMGGDRFPFEDTPVSIGDRVAVIGGGNTAMDCLRVARRLGSTDVHCVYRRTEAEAPARQEELRHAVEEGIQFHWLRSPAAIETDESGDVTALRCQVMELGPPDDSGRRRPIPVEGELHTIQCDTVIYALGTRANPIIAQTTPDLATRWGGYIVADEETQATSMPGVFAGGDIVTGGATVILAMGAGRRAAAGIATWIENRTWPPSEKEAEAPAPAPKTVEKAALSCPKCKRPLEGQDTEGWICCAESSVTWRCESCAKVSEGFAFPYGLCPACGGHLAHKSATEAATADAVAAVRQAFQIELGGRAFYRKGAQVAGDPELADLFTRLAGMEEEHMETLSQRYHVDAPADARDPELEGIAVYAGVEPPSGSAADLLALAIMLEKRALAFFAERRRLVGPPADALYAELEAEEQEHVDLLQTEAARLSADKPGLL